MKKLTLILFLLLFVYVPNAQAFESFKVRAKMQVSKIEEVTQPTGKTNKYTMTTMGCGNNWHDFIVFSKSKHKLMSWVTIVFTVCVDPSETIGLMVQNIYIMELYKGDN